MDKLDITINGVKLDAGQAMTLHAALASYHTQMGEKGCLGNDEHGEFMREAYRQRSMEIINIYLK